MATDTSFKDNNMDSRTIEVNGISAQLLKLLDERVRQEGSDRAAYIRNLIEKDIYGALEKHDHKEHLLGKKHSFDPDQWEADMKALAQRAEEIPVLSSEAFTRESIYENHD